MRFSEGVCAVLRQVGGGEERINVGAIWKGLSDPAGEIVAEKEEGKTEQQKW